MASAREAILSDWDWFVYDCWQWAKVAGVAAGFIVSGVGGWLVAALLDIIEGHDFRGN